MAQIATETKKNGGAFDTILINGSAAMGFRSTPVITQQVSNIAPSFSVGVSGAYNTDAFQAISWFGTENGGDKKTFETADHRYNYSDGQVALQYPDILTLASKWNSTDATQVATCRRIIEYNTGNQFVLVGKATKCRAYNLNTQTWADSGTFTNSVLDLCTNNTYVWAALGSSENYWRLSNTTWSQPAAVKANCFAFFQQKLYRALGNNLFVSSDLGGSLKGWGAAIPVGTAAYNITDLRVISGYLMIAKPEGWWQYDGVNLVQIVNAENAIHTNNFVGATESQGLAYWSQLQDVFKGVIQKGQIGTVQAITPRMKGDANKEFYGHGTPKMMVSAPAGLYVAFHQGEGTYPEILLYNGIGWNQIFRGASSTNMNAFGYSQLLGWLLVNDGATKYKRVTNVGNSEYPDFNSSGYVQSAEFDGGFPITPKVFSSVRGKVSGTGAAKTVKISHSVDNGSFVDDATIANDGPFEVWLKDASGNPVTGNVCQIKLTLASNDASATPRVEFPIVLMGLPTPKALDAQQVTLNMDERKKLWNKMGKWGSYTTYNAGDEFLQDARGALAACVLITGQNKWQSVRLTNLSYDRQILAGGKSTREVAVARLSVLNLYPGPTRSVENYVTVSGAASDS